MASAIPSRDPAVTEYIERARAIPRLSREQEAELAQRARLGDTAAVTALIQANLRFPVAVALQYRRYDIPLAELIAEGNLGLTVAARKFDPDRGTRFVTYAGYWIRAHVLDLVVKSASMVGGGSGVLRSKLYFRLRRERARLAATEVSRDTIIERLAQDFSVTPARMASMLARLDARDVSLHRPVHDDAETTLQDRLLDDGEDLEAALAHDEQLGALQTATAEALSTLDERERFIVQRRIMDDETDSLAELGRQLGVSRERARQLEARAKTKLRAQLSSFAAVA